MARVLLLAPDCDGEDVGEAWVAMQWVQGISKVHDTTVLIQRKRDRASVRDQLPDTRVVEWQQPPLVGRHERLNSMLKPGYVAYYWRARRWIKEALARGEHFDVAHQLSPVALRYPSPLLTFELPYVVGPVGGSLPSPPAFAPEEAEAPWFVGLRKLDAARLRRDQWLRASFERAQVVIGIAPYVQDLLATLDIRSFIAMSDTGVPNLPPPVDRTGRTGPLVLLFVGRVIRTKGVRDAIRALALLNDRSVHLDVVGDGYDRPSCEQAAAELDVAHLVTFHGRVPSNQVGRFYQDADIFLFPSYREPGGIVLAEAMAWGLPAIVCAAGGPGSTVDESTGIRVPAINPHQYADALAEAIDTLAANPDLRLQMGVAARSVASDRLVWDKKLEQLGRIYEQVISLHAPD